MSGLGGEWRPPPPGTGTGVQGAHPHPPQPPSRFYVQAQGQAQGAVHLQQQQHQQGPPQRVTYIRPGALRQMVGVPGRSHYPGLGVKRVHPGSNGGGGHAGAEGLGQESGSARSAGGGAPPRPPKVARVGGGISRPPPSPASMVSGSGQKTPAPPGGRSRGCARGEALSSPAVVRSPASYGPDRTGVTPRTPGGHRGNLLLLPGEVLQRILKFLPHSSVAAVRDACLTLQGQADVAKETHFNFVTPMPSPSGSALLARRARRSLRSDAPATDAVIASPFAAGTAKSTVVAGSGSSLGGATALRSPAGSGARAIPQFGNLRTTSPSPGHGSGFRGGSEWETPASSPFPGGRANSPAGSIDSRQTQQRTDAFGGRIPLQAPGAPKREKTSRSMFLRATGSFDDCSFTPNFAGDDGSEGPPGLGIFDTHTSALKQSLMSPVVDLPVQSQTGATPVGRVLAFPPSSPALSDRSGPFAGE